jgi:hypothetical protein
MDKRRRKRKLCEAGTLLVRTAAVRTSSVIAGLDYNPTTHMLEVEFRTGRVYHYFGVPKAEYEALLNAPSLGRYFNREIRNRYRTREIVRHKRSA